MHRISTERFYVFTLLIDGIHKCIRRLKIDFVPHFGVKSVHIFWVYELRSHPEGLTAAELAGKTMISRSLVSREIERLRNDGYIQVHETAHGKRKNYNARITLTEKGSLLASDIAGKALSVQNRASAGISPEELAAFYVTLEKIYHNLEKVVQEIDAQQTEEPVIPPLPETAAFSAPNAENCTNPLTNNRF